jgi:hypothetical protein
MLVHSGSRNVRQFCSAHKFTLGLNNGQQSGSNDQLDTLAMRSINDCKFTEYSERSETLA